MRILLRATTAVLVLLATAPPAWAGSPMVYNNRFLSRSPCESACFGILVTCVFGSTVSDNVDFIEACGAIHEGCSFGCGL